MMLNTVKDRIRTKGSTSSLGLITCFFSFFTEMIWQILFIVQDLESAFLDFNI